MLPGRRRIQLKTPAQFQQMRVAGLVVADALEAVRVAVAPGVTTAELNEVAADVIAAAGATSNFLGYHGFTGVICASVNDEVVHGIPGSRVLREGDLISIDCGAVVDGWHGDAAITVPVGEISPEHAALSTATRDALWAGIAAARPGNRISDIGAACEKSIAGRYGIVVDYVGHGIGTAMHMDPAVAHVGPGGKGLALKVGMALAIEPMVTAGSPDVDVLSDDWTVVTEDHSWAAHWEHSVAITPTGPFVLTAPDGGLAGLGADCGSLDF
ncbi:MAG: type I methionyl aminopeptidase [Candidatus Nanopelagicales bacterium]